MADRRPTPPRPSVMGVVLPSEHGGWSLTLEPVVLGLLVVASPSGFALGCAALLAFLIRTPVRVVLVDWYRHRWLARTKAALWVAAIEGSILGGLVVVAVGTAAKAFWLPVVVALPFLAVEAWFDARSRSRRLVPELAGSLGVGAAAAMIVLAGGGEGQDAAGVWLVIAARACASIPFVRAQLRRAKGQPFGRFAGDAAQLVAVVVAVVAGGAGLVPWPAVGGIASLAAFQLVMVRRPPPPAAVLGAQQVVAGLTVVLVSALGFGGA